MVDITHQVNEAGMDAIVNNTRVRASLTNPQGINYLDGIGTPVSLNPAGTQTLTAAQLGTGIIVINPSATNTTTFDTATNIVNYFNSNSSGAQIGDVLTCLIINGQGTNSLTLAAGSGGAFDPNQLSASQIIPANSSKYVFIRITNVSTPAYVVYS